jgi:Tfp pilus assembly protein PilO
MKVNRRLALSGGILILTLVGGSLSLLGYYHYSPSAMLLEKLKQRMAEGQRQRDDLSDIKIPEKRRLLDNLVEFRHNLQKITELSDELEQMFPKEERLGELLDLISREAESNGAKLMRIEPGEPTDQGEWWEIPIELEFVCDLTRLQGCLTSIEKMPRFIRIRSFSIALREDGVSQLETKMTCVAFVFQRGASKDET